MLFSFGQQGGGTRDLRWLFDAAKGWQQCADGAGCEGLAEGWDYFI
ncbi:hypothetical protein [Sphingobacterium alkalisoli]|nr:hypothetical protein [Sphingobacterium alkalisoli]